jgi:predicted nucleic acid-binding protein
VAGLIYLIDKSALAPRLGDEGRLRVESLVTSGRLAVCWITVLEVLYSAESAKGWQEGHGNLLALRLLSTTESAFERAVEVQGLLAKTGHHRVPLPDLLIAATAESHGAAVLHNDKDYEIIAAVTGQSVERIV